MKISTKARYGVMALCDLAIAQKKSGGKPISLQDIGQTQEIPIAYLEQIFNTLKKAKLVESTRGAFGGYLLARPANNIRMSDIIYALEDVVKTTRCENHSPKGCHSTGARCLTHDLWEELGQTIHRFLSRTTIQDVVDGRISTPGSFSEPRERIHVL